MKILIERKWKKPTYTIGIISIDGKRFCNTLEDKDRGLKQSMSEEQIKRLKKFGETAIPKGTYEVDYTWSARFRRYMPLIRGVKGFDGVRVHSGNTSADTLGCVLLGKNTIVGKVTNSREYCRTFDDMVKKAIERGDKVTLTIE